MWIVIMELSLCLIRTALPNYTKNNTHDHKTYNQRSKRNGRCANNALYEADRTTANFPITGRIRIAEICGYYIGYVLRLLLHTPARYTRFVHFQVSQ